MKITAQMMAKLEKQANSDTVLWVTLHNGTNVDRVYRTGQDSWAGQNDELRGLVPEVRFTTKDIYNAGTCAK